MCYIPYPVCIGRKYRKKKLAKLNRPLVVIFNSFLCNPKFSEKFKIQFLQQVIRLFYRDVLGFRLDAYFKNNIKCDIQEGDYIRLVCSATKAIIRKLLSKLNYVIDDYKLLKRRKYTLIFTFYFCGINKNTLNYKNYKNYNQNLTLDIQTEATDTFYFFMTIDLYNATDFIQFLFYYYNEEYKV
jgi:hypothetical protein